MLPIIFISCHATLDTAAAAMRREQRTSPRAKGEARSKPLSQRAVNDFE